MPPAFRRPIAEGDPVAAAMLEMRPFLFRDPPTTPGCRGLVSKAFTPKVVESLRARTQQVVDELLDAAMEAGRVDLIEEFAYPLPVRIICDLLGVPVEDQERFKVWSDALARGLDPDFLLTPEVIAAAERGVLQFSQYFFELLAERRRHPGRRPAQRGWSQVEDGGQVLSEAELLSTCILLLVAGHETTVNLIAGGALALLRTRTSSSGSAPIRRSPAAGSRRCSASSRRYSSPDGRSSRTASSEGSSSRPATSPCCCSPRRTTTPPSSRIPNGSTSPGPRTTTSDSASASTTASVRRWPGWRPRWHSPRWSGGRRTLAMTVDGVTYKTNVVLRGMESLPVAMRG